MSSSSDIFRASTFLGITATLVHSGVSLAASQLVIPSMKHLSAAEATSIFVPFYHRGAQVVVPLALASAAGSATSAYLDPEKRYQYAAAAFLAVLSQPWTIIMMAPINSRLLEIGAERGEEKFAGEAMNLLLKWQTLNAFRSLFAFAGGALALATYSGLL